MRFLEYFLYIEGYVRSYVCLCACFFWPMLTISWPGAKNKRKLLILGVSLELDWERWSLSFASSDPSDQKSAQTQKLGKLINKNYENVFKSSKKNYVCSKVN